MADYWAKIYIEIVDDPKMATMPDHLWRRTIEVFLLAKKFNKAGHLPETKQLAWLLRTPTDDLDLDLKQISLTGIVQAEPGGWFVTNFEKRQAAATDAERKRQQRERDQKEQYYGNEDVTEASQVVTQSREQRTEAEQKTETEAEQRPLIFSMYEHEIGIISPRIADELKQAEIDYPTDWIIEAFQEAVDHNARSWKYVLTILKRWKIEGKTSSNGHKSQDVQVESRPDRYGKVWSWKK